MINPTLDYRPEKVGLGAQPPSTNIAKVTDCVSLSFFFLFIFFFSLEMSAEEQILKAKTSLASALERENTQVYIYIQHWLIEHLKN